jgi:hypothetical protein
MTGPLLIEEEVSSPELSYISAVLSLPRFDFLDALLGRAGTEQVEARVSLL